MTTSSEHRELVLTSNRANLHDAIAGLLNTIIAQCLPARPGARDSAQASCDRSTSVTAQATSPHLAVPDVIESLLETIEEAEGGISAVELHGVMTGPDRCTIWAQACLDTPTPYTPHTLTGLTIEQTPGAIVITATLRAEG